MSILLVIIAVLVVLFLVLWLKRRKRFVHIFTKEIFRLWFLNINEYIILRSYYSYILPQLYILLPNYMASNKEQNSKITKLTSLQHLAYWKRLQYFLKSNSVVGEKDLEVTFVLLSINCALTAIGKQSCCYQYQNQ